MSDRRPRHPCPDAPHCCRNAAGTPASRAARRIAARVDQWTYLAARRVRSVHADERGTISILTVFVLLMLTMLLMMLFNTAKQFDDKLRMQNAADAATYSGGVVLARGMNAIAFANHLEADVFAVTAFLREARDQNAAEYVPEVLSAWTQAAGDFAGSPFPKFRPLQGAITSQATLEQQFVTAWSDMAAAASQSMLPVFEYILGTPETQGPGARDHLIPEFQRAIIDAIPTLSQDVTLELALRHGLRQQQLSALRTQARFQSPSLSGARGPQVGVLWRTSVLPVGIADETDPMTRTLPVVDPEPYQTDYGRVPSGSAYLAEARRRRADLARLYLQWWIEDMDPTLGLGSADENARMSQFARLFYAAACARLDQLLNEEFPNTNVPFILRDWDMAPTNQSLERDFTYVGVVYRRHVEESAPKLFRNPLDTAADAQTFAQVTLFIPVPRLRAPWKAPVYGEDRQTGQVVREDYVGDGWDNDWDTFNQNWTIKLVPATSEAISPILASQPGGPAAGLRTPNVGGLSAQDIQAVNTH